MYSKRRLFEYGKTTLPGGDEMRLIASINRMLDDFMGNYRVLPGHRQETTIEHERECRLSTRVTGY